MVMAASKAQQPEIVPHFTSKSFSVSGWYYSCSTASYTIFCKQDTSTWSTESLYLCLEVGSDSSFIITILLSGIEIQYQVSGFQAQTGWTWFAITVNEIYQNTQLIFYASSDSYSGLSVAEPFLYESTILSGFYTADIGDANIVLNFGCRLNVNQVCYRPLIGYFFSFNIWSDYTMSINDLASEISMTCGTTCIVCHTDNTCHDQRSLTIVDLDLEQSGQSITDSSGNSYDFRLGSTISTSTTDDPIRIPYQGMKFGATRFLESRNTPSIQYPTGFVVEAWIRFDISNPTTSGELQYIFQSFRTNQYFAIALDNSYIKVIINDVDCTYNVNWLQNTGWRYIGVTVVRNFYDTLSGLSASQVKIYLDNLLVTTQTLQSYFLDDQTTTISDIIGYGFHGVIRKFRIKAQTYCGYLQSPSVSTTCSALGSTTTCSVCDSSTATCLSTCGFNTIDTNCQECNWKCGSCITTTTNCQECNSSGNLVGTAPTCYCAAGYIQVNNQCLLSLACHSNCATCIDTTNMNCPVCATKSYLFGSYQCLPQCPYGYKEDDTYNLCHFDTNKLSSPVYQLSYLNTGCSASQYVVTSGNTCSSCHSSCSTCKGGTVSDCTSCVLGKYLYNNKCLACDSKGMIVGSSGQCVEICGDGLNFGINECDDKNTVSGDGCSSSCTIEEDYICTGGTSTTKDTCTYIELDFQQITVTENNNIIIKFNKPAYIIGQLTTDDIEITIYRHDQTELTNFNANFDRVSESPSMTLFIHLEINEYLLGDAKRSRVEIYYKRSGKIYDQRLKELKSYAQAFGYLYRYNPQISIDENSAIKGMGILCNFAIVLTIFFTYYLYSKFDISVQPALLLFFGMQEILFSLLMSYDYPLNMMNFWKYFTWMELELSFLPNSFEQNFMDMYQISTSSYKANFQFLNYVADSFIINSHLKMYIWFTYTIAFFVHISFSRKLYPKYQDKIMTKFLYSGTIILFMCCLMPFGYASFIEIQNLKQTLPFKMISVASSFFILATIFFFLSSIMQIAYKGKQHYFNEHFIRKYYSILKPFRCKTICLLYYPLFCWKRVIQLIIVALFVDTPLLQTALTAVLQGMFMAYVIINRPYLQNYNNILSIISQIFPLTITLYSLAFTYSLDQPEKAFNFGWGPIVIISVYCYIHCILSIVYNILHILERNEQIVRYKINIEKRVWQAFLDIFYRRGAAEELTKKVALLFNPASVEVPKQEEDEQKPFIEEELLLPNPEPQPTIIQAPLKINNNFNVPLGINQNQGLTNSLQTNLLKANKILLPSIEQHKPKFDPRLLVTPTDDGLFKMATKKSNNLNEVPQISNDNKDQKKEQDEEEYEDANMSMAATSFYTKSQRKTRKVKKKVKKKGDTIKAGDKFLNPNLNNDGPEYLLL